MSEKINKYHSDDQTLGLTSQRAVEVVGNRYDLVLIASQRVRELKQGNLARVASKHGPILTALKEIEQGKVDQSYLYKFANQQQRRRGRGNYDQ
jgi:DNA-directed RNA polymerase subunit omega